MQLTCKFKNIQSNNVGKSPCIIVKVNNNNVYSGPVIPTLSCELELKSNNNITISFVNKLPEDTTVDEYGNVTSDVCFELDDIAVDGESFGDMLWKQGGYTSNNEHVPGCLFFGPAGSYEIEFIIPLLRWKLKTNHELHGNDPDWETDYTFYTTACNILQITK